MKHDLSNEEIDNLIRQTLSEDEAKYYDQIDEQGLMGQLFGLFKGKMKWYNILIMIISLIIVGLSIYCLVQFLNADSTNDLIRWGAGMFAGLIIQSLLKTWSWNQMDKYALIREMKRLEYQISLIHHDKQS